MAKIDLSKYGISGTYLKRRLSQDLRVMRKVRKVNWVQLTL